MLHHIHDYLVQAGAKVYQVNNQLTHQLRKFVDDRIILENRRVVQLVQNIENLAVGLRDREWPSCFAEVQSLKIDMSLELSRPLFNPPDADTRPEAPLSADEVSKLIIDKLFDQFHIDEDELRDRIDEFLATDSQVSLSEILARFPLSKGLSELITYIKLASERPTSLFPEKRSGVASYRTAKGEDRAARYPDAIFTRSADD